MSRNRRLSVIVLLVVFALGSPAYASLACGGSFFFSVSGFAPSDPTKPEDAEACVTINGDLNTITVVLDNTASNITNIPSVLDGFSFVLSGPTPSSYTGLSASVPNHFLDCTERNACTVVTTFNAYSGPQPNTQVSPYEWATITGASGAPISQTFSLSNPALLAGAGSLRPAAIVDSFAAVNHLGGPGHNDYLIGPVTFTLTYTGADPTDVELGRFYFGTLGESPGGGVPEPTSVLLLGTVLAFVGRFLHGRLAA